MKCPNDNATLLITDRNGIEVDYCPECRGVWLDRGELDKLIERSGQVFSSQPHHGEHRSHNEHREEYRDRGHGNDHHKKHKRENPFEDFFDFG